MMVCERCNEWVGEHHLCPREQTEFQRLRAARKARQEADGRPEVERLKDEMAILRADYEAEWTARREKDALLVRVYDLLKAAQDDGCNWPGSRRECLSGNDCNCGPIRDAVRAARNPAGLLPDRPPDSPPPAPQEGK